MVNDSFRKSIHSKEHLASREFWIAKRKALNLSQRQLAERLNVIYSLVGKIGTGDRRLDTAETIEYCRVFEVDPNEIKRYLWGQIE